VRNVDARLKISIW